MKKIEKVVSIFMFLISVISLSACSSKIDSLEGYWKEASQNETWHEATILNNSIEIHWVSNDMDALYWRGTYIPPENSVSKYSWISTSTIPDDEFNMLASTEKTKNFSYKDGFLCYSASAMGVTKKVKLKLVDKYDETSENNTFSISPNVENCDIVGENISIVVDNLKSSINLLNAFSIPNNYSWELYSDIECYSSSKIESKNINLNIGDNIYYGLFVNNSNPKDKYFYQIGIYRKQKITITLDVNGGEELNNKYVTVQYGDSFELPTPKNGSYKFVGWFINDKLINQSKFEFKNNITATAKWSLNISSNYVYFGKYPQTLVKDSNLISELNKINSFNNYGYLVYEGNVYCRFKAEPFEDTHSYIPGQVYYFKVEPIKWQILSSSNGIYTLISSSILDSHIFDKDDNNYEKSDIRTFLNSTFYNMAFSLSDGKYIQTTFVDNSIESAGGYSGNYPTYTNDTNDKVYLLSYKEASQYFTTDISRKAKGTDFAIASGLYVYEDIYGVSPTEEGYSYWYTRSRGFNSTFKDYSSVYNIWTDGRIVRKSGNNGYLGNDGKMYDFYGIRPVISILVN